MQEVYDGVHLPEELSPMPGAFRLQIAKGPFDDSKKPVYDTDNPDNKAIWISLPIDRDQADSFARELGESCIEDCVFYGFESAIQQIGSGKFDDMWNFELLNEIAARFIGMNEMEQIKYKAVLQSQVFLNQEDTLTDALEAARHIGEYELSYYSDNNANFAATYLAYHLPTGFDVKWLGTVRALDMGKKLLDRLGACSTEYGVVSARGKSLFELVPFEEPQENEIKTQTATNQKFDLIEIYDGRKALYGSRVPQETLSKNLYQYDLGNGALTFHSKLAQTINSQDYVASILVQEPIGIPPEGYLELGKTQLLRFLGDEMTIDEFMNTDFTQQEDGGMTLE